MNEQDRLVYLQTHEIINEAVDCLKHIELPRSLEELTDRRFIIDCALAGRTFDNKRHGLGKPPEYLLHIMQVDLVTGRILENAPPEAQLLGRAYSLTHDIGRIYTLGSQHPYIGFAILSQITNQGFDNQEFDKVALMAKAHHNWGNGIWQLGLANGFDDKDGKEELYEYIEEEFSLGALAFLFADGCKTVKDDSFVPKIEYLDKQLGWSNIDTQIKRGRFKKGSIEHQRELYGLNLVLGTVEYLEKCLGISVRFCVEEAKIRWPKEEEEFIAIYNERCLACQNPLSLL